MVVNDFRQDLKYSYKDKILNTLYKNKCNVKYIQVITDLQKQKQGIDKVLYFNNGKSITIDEKKRRRDYGDMLIETTKNVELNKKGWIYYTKADYIVYWIEGSRSVYFINFKKLQRLYLKNQITWNMNYKIPPVYNKYYTTQNIAVPWHEIRSSIERVIKY